jgi:hypothetical protein
MGPGEARQNEAERNRAAKIAEQKGENALKHPGNRFDGKEDRNLAFQRRRGNRPIPAEISRQPDLVSHCFFAELAWPPKVVSQFEFQ